MTRRKTNRWARVPTGTFTGKTVTLASTDGVDAHSDIAAQFMSTIFELDLGDYLITDEASVLDFTPADESDTTESWSRIEETYGITKADVGSDLLVRIFESISKPRRAQ